MHAQTMVTLAQATAPTFAAMAIAEILAEAREKHGEENLPPVIQELLAAAETRAEKLMREFAKGLLAGTDPKVEGA